jgi:hypothetical protein
VAGERYQARKSARLPFAASAAAPLVTITRMPAVAGGQRLRAAAWLLVAEAAIKGHSMVLVHAGPALVFVQRSFPGPRP